MASLQAAFLKDAPTSGPHAAQPKHHQHACPNEMNLSWMSACETCELSDMNLAGPVWLILSLGKFPAGPAWSLGGKDWYSVVARG